MITKTNNVVRQTPRNAITERPIRRADNLFLINNEIKEISNKAVRAEFVAVPFLAVLSLVSGMMHNSIAQKQMVADNAPTNSQNNSFLNNPFWLASTSNAVLDLLSFLGELQGRPICAVGNFIRMIVNSCMAFGDATTRNIANIFYNFASGIIAIGWGISSQSKIVEELRTKETFWDKTKFQLNTFTDFFRELPSNIKEKRLWNNQVEHESLKSRMPMFGFFTHAALAFISTGILLISNFLPKEEKYSSDKTSDVRNTTADIGWKAGKLSRFPLLVSIFADIFNPYNLLTYKISGAVLKFLYLTSAVLNMIHMHDPQKTAQTDFWKNLLSNSSSLWTRYIDNKS